MSNLDFVTDKNMIFEKSVSIFDIIERPNKPLEEFSSKELGKEGERISALFLLRKDFYLIEMNWRCRFGEVDIVAQKHDEPKIVHLVEVKTRLNMRNENLVIPELSVTKAKKQKYKKLALMYMALHPEYETVRFDVISIAETGWKQAHLRYFMNAFSIDGE